MIDKFRFYRFVFPFRSRLQNRLREARLHTDVHTFVRGIGLEAGRTQVSRLLWEMLREQALVPDYRPDPDESLPDIHGAGDEEVTDEIILPLLEQLECDIEGVDFTGTDLRLLTTPRHVADFIVEAMEKVEKRDAEAAKG